MRLTLFTAVALSLISGLLPGCDRTTTGKQVKDGSAASDSSSGQSAAGAVTGQASEGSTQKR